MRQLICVILNIPPLYRKGIFGLMDTTFDIDWFFGCNSEDSISIQQIPLDEFKRASKLMVSDKFKLVWQHNVVKLIFSKQYDQFIMLGEPFCISTWMAMILKNVFARKKRIYLWSHGWYGREGFAKKWLKRCFFGLADGTFLYSNYAKKVAITQGNNPDKLWVIHNSLDYERHMEIRDNIRSSDIYKKQFNNNAPILIFIGRLTKVKKLNQIIEAVAQLKEKGEVYNIVFVGDGSERNSLEKLAHKCNIRVWFYGSCYDEVENARLIYNADLCVSPGNVGLTAIHAMTFGTPVLSHSNFVNQMPEFEAIIEGKTGAFFYENSIESIAKCISSWFNQQDYDRNKIREDCYEEIAASWTPRFQMEVLRTTLS